MIDACIDSKLDVVALSTDKGSPANLYGATKLASDKVFVAGNSHAGTHTSFAVVRYGNVMIARPSDPILVVCQPNQPPITDENDAFYDHLRTGVELVWRAFEDMVGGEIYVRKTPSMNILT